MLKHFVRTRHDLKKRYGENTWAVVTGASDGIGAEYCRGLALEGFNIALVSRTLSKLQSVEHELRRINPKIQTKIVQADFSGNATQSFYDNIYNQLRGLDISILINNAGLMTNKLFEDLSP